MRLWIRCLRVLLNHVASAGNEPGVLRCGVAFAIDGNAKGTCRLGSGPDASGPGAGRKDPSGNMFMFLIATIYFGHANFVHR